MMRKTLAVGLVLATMILTAVYISYSCSSSTVAVRIPDTIKQEASSVLDESQYGSPRWRGYRKDGSSELVVLEAQMSGPLLHERTFFFITFRDGQVTGTYSFIPDGAKFQAHAGNGMHIVAPEAYRPAVQALPDHWVFGTASDRRIALIRVSTEDGRTLETQPFDGCWWLESSTTPSTVRDDKWVGAVALDSSGRVLFQVIPKYPANWPH